MKLFILLLLLNSFTLGCVTDFTQPSLSRPCANKYAKLIPINRTR